MTNIILKGKELDRLLLIKQVQDRTMTQKEASDVLGLSERQIRRLAILGVDTKDEALTNVYLKKQMVVFGLDHPRTKEALQYLDERDLALPF